jgi:hypothetical protein
MGKNHHPIKDMVIQFPSQPSEDKRRAPPRGVQRQPSFKTHSEHESSTSKADRARAVNQWHSEHGPAAKRSSLARIIHSKTKTVYEAKDLNMDTYEPFLKAMRIPSEFSGDRSIKMQQMQMKESIEGNRQKKTQRRASSTFDGSPPIPPKRRPPSRASRSLDENVFMSQLGRQRVPNRVKKENVRPPIPQEAPTPPKRVPTPPKRVPPKVPLNIIKTLDLDEFRRSLGRERNPYLRKKFEQGSYKHGIDFKVLTIAEIGPQPLTPASAIRKAVAA